MLVGNDTQLDKTFLIALLLFETCLTFTFGKILY